MNTEPEETKVGASDSSGLLGQLPEYSHNFRPRWPGDEGGFTATQMREYAAQQVTAERERWRATVLAGHLYAGQCPDEVSGINSRDQYCSLCQLLVGITPA